MKRKTKDNLSNFKEQLRRVKAFVFDVDGVLSAQTMLLDTEGNLIRTSNIRDGFAIQRAVNKNYPVGIITGAEMPAVMKRYQGLGITDIYLGSTNKKSDIIRFLKKYRIEASDVLYMGDDLPDLEVMKMVGFPTCPDDAVVEVKQISKYISNFTGGNGCVRDVIEQVLRLHKKWVGSLSATG